MFDFSLESYSAVLDTILKYEYITSFFDEKGEKKSIYIRHDIDVDLNSALRMATLENSKSIFSTYFVMLNSPIYNLFSRNNINIIEKILRMGHKIGLHHDCVLDKNDKIQDSVDLNIDILNRYFGIDINVVSFHQPSNEILENKIRIKQINTYDKKYFEDIYYISDSNMIWKDKNPISLIKSNKFQNIQLLIHPLWWIDSDVMTTEDRWKLAISRNFYHEQKQLLSTERAYGNEKEIVWKQKK